MKGFVMLRSESTSRADLVSIEYPTTEVMALWSKQQLMRWLYPTMFYVLECNCDLPNSPHPLLFTNVLNASAANSFTL